MAHTRSEGTGVKPALQERMEERDRQLDADSLRWLWQARAARIRLIRTDFPPEALEAE